MKTLKIFHLAFSAILLCMVSTPLSARIFTDREGKTFEGKIINISGGKVSVIVPGKTKIYHIPISKLSDSDQDYFKARKSGKTQQKSLNSNSKKAPLLPNNQGDRIGNQSSILPKKPSRPPQTPPRSESSPSSSNELKRKYLLVDNYLTNWPNSVSVPINVNVKTISINKDRRHYVYHSPNYEFVSDVPLTNTIITKFSLLFEATREYCRKLPISSMKAHLPGTVSRNKVFLFANLHTYYANGGKPKAAGVYIPRNNSVIIPLSSLGVVKKHGKYVYDNTGTNSVITHELIHQLTDIEYFQHGALGWFSEGLAEYCTATQYQSGKFVLRKNLKNIKEYVTAYGRNGVGGRALGQEILAPDLKGYMLQPYQSFLQQANHNYGLATLFTYYFFHMESDRRNIIKFMKALKNGKKGEDAIKYLLAGRSYDELEKDISKAWKVRGITITFK